MKVHFFINGEDDYTSNDIGNIDAFKTELVSYVENTLQWEYGTKRDFYDWLEGAKFGQHVGNFTVSGSNVVVLHHVELETIKTFIKIWNQQFGDMQMIEYNIIYWALSSNWK